MAHPVVCRRGLPLMFCPGVFSLQWKSRCVWLVLLNEVVCGSQRSPLSANQNAKILI